MNESEQVVSQYLKSQDDLEFRLGDTLDIKTSIALVVIIFLATQSAGFLALSSIPLHWRNTQIVSAMCLAIAGIAAVWELVPRKYRATPDSAQFCAWIEQLGAFFKEQAEPNIESKIVEEIRRKEIDTTKARITHNCSINKSKLCAMDWAFKFTVAALACNLATLLALSFRWRF